MRAAFTTLGCKVNQYETQRILETFEEAGFAVVPFDAAADVYVINTCSVTSIAESKSRYAVRRARRAQPDAVVVVTGCATQMALNREEHIPDADVMVPNPDKLETLTATLRARPDLRPIAVVGPRPRSTGRTRATLKVQDGCSVFCSYCSIPYTRPRMESRPAEDVLDEAERLVAMGYREIVLTGVLIGSYGPQTGSGGPDFETLVEQIADRCPGARLRISSIEMRQVTDRLIGLMEDGRVVPHLHIPLQSGDTDVLRDMNRPYTQADYLRLVERLHRRVPDFVLTMDVMVGFPTETAERFESTLHVVRETRPLKVHAFRFSPRFGTPADAWGDPIEPTVKQARAEALNALSGEVGDGVRRRFLGRTLRVLVEGKVRRDGLLEGLTDNYVEARFAGSPQLARSYASVRLDEAREGACYGEIAIDRPGLLVRKSGSA
ncbi:MAG TPA: tRNA (N(6)-L-threonylcarbamoyladenosine(37)-C(2))-methylthiotransferase MtaB [Fimbriimonadaceae bacterium]|nr:tRNA (N(6)-L-threonylcarbamoyladenosine(37)-C(2))-methylthiotransferase MtaB [Fimbriimonadaceae bacterium]